MTPGQPSPVSNSSAANPGSATAVALEIIVLSLDSRTQNAPSRIAPTNANTAQITRTFSLTAMSTSLASQYVDQTKV
jgi:hypothetical protein